MGQGAEHRPVRAAKGTPALLSPEAGRRNDCPRPARPDAAIPVDAARCITVGKTGRPSALPGSDAGAPGDLRSPLPPLVLRFIRFIHRDAPIPRLPGERGCNPIGLHRPFATNYVIPAQAKAQAGTHSAAGVELSDGTRSQKR